MALAISMGPVASMRMAPQGRKQVDRAGVVAVAAPARLSSTSHLAVRRPLSLLNKRLAVPTGSRSLTLATRAQAASAAASPKAAASNATEGTSVSFLNRILVAVAKFLISLLPGRLGLTWLAAFLPSKVKRVFLDLFDNYVKEMIKAVGDAKKAEAVTMVVFKDMCKTYAEQMLVPYTFPSHHKAMRSPTDYYKMGQQYIGCLIDFDRSVLSYPDRWTQVQNWLAAGENVILLANHQSEGDAAFIPLMTELSHPGLGEKVTYIAGGRVISDKLSKPFSMGRNLLCVNSKKHMTFDPSTRSEKMRQNVRTLKEMDRLLAEGGMLIWVAPSGGRDRWNDEGIMMPADFDSAVIDMMVKLGTKPKAQTTHFMPLAMSTAEIMPPPKTTEKALGEERIVHYTGAGLSLGEEVDVSTEGPWAQGVDHEDKAACSSALTSYIYDRTVDLYKPIMSCNELDGGVEPLPENSIRPVKPAIVPR